MSHIGADRVTHSFAEKERPPISRINYGIPKRKDHQFQELIYLAIRWFNQWSRTNLLSDFKN